MNTSGFVYILSNAGMPGLYKIGFTSDIEKRMSDLYTTSVPFPFTCEYACRTTKYRELERALHLAFDDKRVNREREFFKLNPASIIPLLAIMDDDAQDETEAVDRLIRRSEEDKRSEEAFAHARPNVNFYTLGLQTGDVITFRDSIHAEVTATIADERRVIMEGDTEPVYLTPLTQRLRCKTYASQPTPYWYTAEGRCLLDLYNETYA